MMIEINHRTLRDAAAAITTYCAAQDKEMRSADTEMQLMFVSGWVGSDANEFKMKWAGVNTQDSTAAKFRESLKNYGESLVACANEYENAQVESINAAGPLVRLVGR